MRASLRSVPLLAASFAIVACSNATEAPPGAVAARATEASAADGPQKATATPVKPTDKKQFGAAITETAVTPLTAIAGDPGKFGGKTVRTQGVVTAVCKSMGCWMEIGDEASLAHIQMAGHSFFVPRDSSGHHAVVQGKVLTEPAATCGDGCRDDAAKAGGKIAKIEIEATGVELVD